MNANNTKSEEDVIEQMQNGEMTYVEYIMQHDEDVRDEYEQYCHDNGLELESEDSAMAFIEYREDELDASMEN